MRALPLNLLLFIKFLMDFPKNRGKSKFFAVLKKTMSLSVVGLLCDRPCYSCHTDFNEKLATISKLLISKMSNTVVPLDQRRLNNSADLYLANSTKQTKWKLFQ